MQKDGVYWWVKQWIYIPESAPSVHCETKSQCGLRNEQMWLVFVNYVSSKLHKLFCKVQLEGNIIAV